MSKNIVLCSDGTANKGGVGKETNVWRLYRAIDRNSAAREQVAFYDDGVGTEDNKYVKALSSAFGWGFTRNVKDLYKFLVRSYKHEDEDDIYMFGFSRGAYTVRALAAFVTACGVIDNASHMTEIQLNGQIDRLVDAYHNRTDKPVAVDGINVVRPKIKAVGVWDTVSAIGLPFDDLMLEWLILKFLFKFNFGDNVLSNNVEYGFQALAIDDQRLTFHPKGWKERANVEQVWFTGVHSNVGGGYPKQGMAYVALDWMMDKVENGNLGGGGLHFDQALRAAAGHHAHVHDKLYNSRAGVAAYYRYTPRDIEKLNPGSNPIKIHDSVFDRIDYHTLGYNPGNLPTGARGIDVVATGGRPVNARRQARVTISRTARAGLAARANKWVETRKTLHLAFVLWSMLLGFGMIRMAAAHFSSYNALADFFVLGVFTVILIVITAYMKSFLRAILCLAAGALFFWFEKLHQRLLEILFDGSFTLWKWVHDVMDFLLPDLLASIVVDFIGAYPFGALAVVIVAVILAILKFFFRARSARVFEQMCGTLRP